MGAKKMALIIPTSIPHVFTLNQKKSSTHTNSFLRSPTVPLLAPPLSETSTVSTHQEMLTFNPSSFTTHKNTSPKNLVEMTRNQCSSYSTVVQVHPLKTSSTQLRPV